MRNQMIRGHAGGNSHEAAAKSSMEVREATLVAQLGSHIPVSHALLKPTTSRLHATSAQHDSTAGGCYWCLSVTAQVTR